MASALDTLILQVPAIRAPEDSHAEPEVDATVPFAVPLVPQPQPPDEGTAPAEQALEEEVPLEVAPESNDETAVDARPLAAWAQDVYARATGEEAATPSQVGQPDDDEKARVVRAVGWIPKLAAGMVDLAVALAMSLGYAVVAALELPDLETVNPDAVALTGVDRLLDQLAQHALLIAGVYAAVGLSTAVYEAVTVVLMGRTAGQALMAQRLVRLDGRPLGMVRPVLRGLLSGAGLLLLGAGWLWAPFDARRQGAHDRWTGLLLVESPEPTPPPASPPPAEEASPPSQAESPVT